MNRRRSLMATAIILALAATGAVNAQTTSSDEWEYLVAPYLWTSALEGTVTNLGVPAEVGLSFSDTVDILEGGALVHFEASNNRWTVLADAIYLAVSQDIDLAAGAVDVDQAIAEATVGYRFAENFDGLFGVRYTSVDTELRFGAPINMTVASDQDWLDPLIGARWRPVLSERWSAYLRGDLGGFGVGSDLSWQLRAGALLEASKRISVSFGYRLLDYDYEDGVGASQFAYDVRLSGLEVGLGIHF